MELKSFETNGMILAIGSLLNDVGVSQIMMPDPNGGNLVLYTVKSKDEKLDITINPNDKTDYMKKFMGNLVSIYNYVYDAKVKPKDNFKTSDCMWYVTLLFNSAKDSLVANYEINPPKALFVRGLRTIDGFSEMEGKANPLSGDFQTAFSAGAFISRTYKPRVIKQDDLELAINDGRSDLKFLWEQSKDELTHELVARGEMTEEEALETWDEVFGNDNELEM